MSIRTLLSNANNSWIRPRIYNLKYDSSISVESDSVTQTTSPTTSVTINKQSGKITTVNLTTASGAGSVFTVNNNQVGETDVIIVNVINYSGTPETNGYPYVEVVSRTNGSFDLVVFNNHNSNALSGTVEIAFSLLHQF